MQNRAPSFSSAAAPPNSFGQAHTASTSSSNHSISTQQASLGQLPNRARIASSASNQTPPSAAGLPSAQGGIGASSGGGGSRLSRGSPAQSLPLPPSLSTSATASSAGQSKTVSQILLAQVYVLLGRLNTEKDPVQRKAFADQIDSALASSGMEVFHKYFRRLLQSNAPYIFNDAAIQPGSYELLRTDVEKIRVDAADADKIAESIDSTEGDLFRNFDVSSFMDHFKLDPVAKTMLALSLKNASKPDLRTKADAILTSVYPNFLMAVLRPTSEIGADLPNPYLFALLERLISSPPRNWTEENKKDLQYAIRTRYEALHLPVPPNIMTILQVSDLPVANNPVIKLIQRAGPRGTMQVDECKEMLALLDPREVTHTNVADALLYMVFSQDLDQPYNPAVFVATLKDHRAGRRLDWQDVVGSFDRPFLIISKQQFLQLYKALLPLAQEYENFDLQLLWGGQWQHPETQMLFVAMFLSCLPEDMDASTIPRLRKAYSPEDFEDASDEVKEYASKAVRYPFVSLEAVTALFSLAFQSEQSYSHAVHLKIPETVINPHTDMFVLATGAINGQWGDLQLRAFLQLFGPFIRKKVPHDEFVLHGLWKRDNVFLIRRLADLYNASPLDLMFIYAQAKKHEWVQTLTDLPTEFGVDMAALAHSEGDLDLPTWLERSMNSLGDVFPPALARILESKAKTEIELQRNQLPPMNSLSLKTVSGFLYFLENALPEETFLLLLKLCITAYPRLINYGEGVDDVLEANSKSGHALSPDADHSMHEYFQILYSDDGNVRNIVETLQKLKPSEAPEDQELFISMINNLFTEYPYFSEYPLKALQKTAVLFGGAIAVELLSKHALQVGLSMVLEAVQTSKTLDEKIWKFGLQALKQFQTRLPDWPHFCERLLGVQQLQGTDIWTMAQEILKNQGPSDEVSLPPQPLTNGNTEEHAEEMGQVFASINPDTSGRNDYYEKPPEEVQDKVLFVLNNVSIENIQEKMGVLRSVLEDRYRQWFAEYLVDQRAKLQANFQNIYLTILDLLSDKLLWQEVMRETFISISRLLNSEASMGNGPEKQHLKSLGSWLGSMTLARDLPIKLHNLSLKELIQEGFVKQRLPAVVPFAAKVMVEAAKSELFLPPNPWTVEILRMLLEIYHSKDVRINLKFEVEHVCDTLKFDRKTEEPSSLLVTQPPPIQPIDDFLPSMDELDPEPFHDMTLLRSRATRGSFSPASVVDNLPNISDRLMYPPHTSNAIPVDQLRSVFATAAQQAIQEIIFPVVERSVTIAAISAYQMVVKDYALEPDENKVRTAAHTVVKNLAGALAMVTCREPLRMTMSNNVRAVANKIPDSIPEGSILMFVNDNIDVVCRVIEEAAERHSLPEIDASLREWFEQRSHDPMVSRYAYAIPEPYKPSPGGLRPEQLAIYENFAPSGLAHPASSQDVRQQIPDALQEQLAGIGLDGPHRQRMSQPVQQVNGYGEQMTILERVEATFIELLRVVRDAPEERISQLNKDSPVREVYDGLLQIVQNGPRLDAVCGYLGEKAMQELFVSVVRPLDMEILCQLLMQLVLYSRTRTTTQETARIIYMNLATWEEEHLLHPVLVVSLLRTSLVSSNRMDTVLHRFLMQKNEDALQSFEYLVEELLLNDHPLEIRTSFSQAYDAVIQWLFAEPDNAFIQGLVDKLRLPDDVPIPAHEPDEVEALFEEWMQIYKPDMWEKLMASFINQLQKRELFKTANDTAHFVRGCMDLSILSFEQLWNPAGPSQKAYQYVDGLASLIVALTVYYTDPDSNDDVVARGKFFEALISALVLHQIHHIKQRGESMNQKVYTRLWSSLLLEVQHLNTTNASRTDLFNRLAYAFLALSPCYVPGFSFGWLGLISHRVFIPAMLHTDDEQSSDLYLHLLENMFDTIRNVPEDGINAPASFLYYLDQFRHGVMTIMVLLHHDFPDFLAEHHFRLCNAVSDEEPQIKNLVISAVPHSVRLLDFFQDRPLAEIDGMQDTPPVEDDYLRLLEDAKILGLVEAVAKGEDVKTLIRAISEGQPQTTAKTLREKHLYATVHAVILYLGTIAAESKNEIVATQIINQVQKIGYALAADETDSYLLHAFTESIINQMRFPSSHTFIFLTVFMDILSETDSEDLQQTALAEMQLRGLVERLLMSRPHAWGTITAFLKLRETGVVERSLVRDVPEVQQIIRTLDGQYHQGPQVLPHGVPPVSSVNVN